MKQRSSGHRRSRRGSPRCRADLLHRLAEEAADRPAHPGAAGTRFGSSWYASGRARWGGAGARAATIASQSLGSSSTPGFGHRVEPRQQLVGQGSLLRGWLDLGRGSCRKGVGRRHRPRPSGVADTRRRPVPPRADCHSSWRRRSSGWTQVTRIRQAPDRPLGADRRTPRAGVCQRRPRRRRRSRRQPRPWCGQPARRSSLEAVPTVSAQSAGIAGLAAECAGESAAHRRDGVGVSSVVRRAEDGPWPSPPVALSSPRATGSSSMEGGRQGRRAAMDAGCGSPGRLSRRVTAARSGERGPEVRCRPRPGRTASMRPACRPSRGRRRVEPPSGVASVAMAAATAAANRRRLPAVGGLVRPGHIERLGVGAAGSPRSTRPTGAMYIAAPQLTILPTPASRGSTWP